MIFGLFFFFFFLFVFELGVQAGVYEEAGRLEVEVVGVELCLMVSNLNPRPEGTPLYLSPSSPAGRRSIVLHESLHHQKATLAQTGQTGQPPDGLDRAGAALRCTVESSCAVWNHSSVHPGSGPGEGTPHLLELRTWCRTAARTSRRVNGIFSRRAVSPSLLNFHSKNSSEMRLRWGDPRRTIFRCGAAGCYVVFSNLLHFAQRLLDCFPAGGREGVRTYSTTNTNIEEV